jgi:phage regulator Rha-like protein
MPNFMPIERITSKIYQIRNIKVMLDRDLAELYGVSTKVLKQAVRRNIKRFPEDFMFELTREEFLSWRSQFVTSNGDKMGLRYSPMAFTEQGVAMLSSVLNSERAIQVNILIIRAFNRLREMLSTHAELKRKVEAMESKYDSQFKVVFDAIKQLLEIESKPKPKIGFKLEKPGAAQDKKGKKKKT